MFTPDDVGPKMVAGVAVELSPEEKQAIADAWNAELAKPAPEPVPTLAELIAALKAKGVLTDLDI